jgi:succinoglycan biosynthesis transport protein ExoP
MNETTVVLPARRDGARAVAASAAPINAYPAYPTTEEREGGAFGNVAAMLRRRIRLVLIVFLGIVAAGVGLTLLQTPKYSATALLMINPNPDQVVSEKQSLTSSRADAGSVDSEIEVLKSPALAARLASELKLDADPEWTSGPGQPVRLPTDAQTSTSAAYSGFPGVEPAATQSLAPSAPAAAAGLLTGSSATPPAPKVADGVVAAVAEAIDIRRRGLSYVVEVSVTSQSPERAAEMANGLSNIYLKSLAEARYDTSEKANAWLKDRLDELKIEVQQKQAAAQAYRASRNLMTIQGTGLAEQQIAVIQTSLLQTRAEYAQKRSEYEQLNSISNKGQTVSSFSGGSDTMRELRSQEAVVGQRVADLENRYGPAHPALQQAKEEKASLDARIAQEMQRTAAKAKVESDALAARLNTQEGALGALRGELVAGNFDQVRLDALETDAEAAQSVYESFLQRYHEVARQGTLASVGARLLSLARPPVSPTSPHLLFNTALAVAAGLMLAFLAGLLAEQFRGTIETTEEVEQRVGARALVAVPQLRNRDMRHMPRANRNPPSYLLTKRMSPYAEAFRVLQASVHLSNHTQNKVVAITSAMPGEGKTTLSLGLARVAAMGGQNVIIVDCDVRMRAINKVLEIDPQEGLQQVLSGEKNWRDVVGCDKASGAHVLPASSLTSKDLFGTGAMENLITELAEQYDLVVLDCAPVFAVADTRVVASLADAVIVAARARKTPARALAAAISQLEIAGARVLGVALNRVDTRGGRRSFYDGLYYSKAFQGYYTKDA